MLAIESLLLEHGVKPTSQRAVIAEFLFSTCSHPSAEDVFLAVKDRLPVSLSRATVYNTLNCFVAAGVIKEVLTEAGKVRYDAKQGDHHHFIDLKTGNVFDIEPELVSQIQLNLGEKFRVKNVQVTVYGEYLDKAD